MKTKTINLYEFHELSEEAKQKAIENISDINIDFDWWNFTYEDAENIGLKITSFDLDRDRRAEGHFLVSAEEVAQKIINEHGGTCETYKVAKEFIEERAQILDKYTDKESEELEEEIEELEETFLKSLLRKYLRILDSEYEYRQSEEAIIETIEANGYTFTESGKLENL